MEVLVLLRRWANEEKLNAHGVHWDEVEEVLGVDLWVPSRHDDYPNQVRIIGPTHAGRMLTIVLEETSDPTVWRPVIGWPSDGDEMAYYRDEIQ
jgi:hypothetical protein